MSKSAPATQATEQTETAVIAQNTSVSSNLASLGFKVAKRITLPLIKPQLEKPVFVLINEAVFVGKKIEQGTSKDMEAAHIANVTDIETGEQAQIIVPSVLLGIFKDEYPDNSYVGKAFQLTKHAKASGKRYHAFTVIELEKA